MAGVQAEHVAVVALQELVAGVRPLQAEAEVRPQLQAVAQGIGRHLGAACGIAAVPLARQAVARGVAAVRRVHRVEAAEGPAVEAAGIDQPLRDLVGRVPAGGVGHRAGLPALGRGAAAEGEHTVAALQAFGHGPRPVVAHQLDGGQRGDARCHLTRAAQHPAAVATLAQRELAKVLVQAGAVGDVGRAGRGEVAAFGEVRALAVVDALHQLGHQEIQVGVALAVGVRGHVHRHAAHAGGEVGAVVKVEAAQKVLVGLAVTRVLGDDHARHKFKHLARAQRRPALEQLGGDHALRCGVAAAHRVVVVAADLDLLGLGGRWLLCGRQAGPRQGQHGGAGQHGEGAGAGHG